MRETTFGFIGLGSMGAAVLRGLLAQGHLTSAIRATTQSQSSAKKCGELGISIDSLENNSHANYSLVTGSEVVVLGIKPYQLVAVMKNLWDAWRTGQTVISMAAGVTLDTLRFLVPGGVEVIRSMPNTPAKIGRGVTGLVMTGSPEASRAKARYLFEAVGEVVECKDEQLDWLSAISGSGPAYVFYLVEQLEEISQRHGFDQNQSQLLVRNTLSGALELLEKSQASPAELRRQVTSPNGTTEKAISIFDSSGLGEIFERAMSAAVSRAVEIAEEQSRAAKLG